MVDLFHAQRSCEQASLEVFDQQCKTGAHKTHVPQWLQGMLPPNRCPALLLRLIHLEAICNVYKCMVKQLRSFARQLTAGSELFKSAKLQNNFHGREVRQMRFLSDAQPLVEGAPAPIIFASGGEDCRLRMFQCKRRS